MKIYPFTILCLSAATVIFSGCEKCKPESGQNLIICDSESPDLASITNQDMTTEDQKSEDMEIACKNSDDPIFAITLRTNPTKCNSKFDGGVNCVKNTNEDTTAPALYIDYNGDDIHPSNRSVRFYAAIKCNARPDSVLNVYYRNKYGFSPNEAGVKYIYSNLVINELMVEINRDILIDRSTDRIIIQPGLSDPTAACRVCKVSISIPKGS